MKMKRLSLAVALVVLLMAGAAQASLINQSVSISLQTLDFDKFLTVSQFNPAWGTLLNVTFDLTQYIEGQVKLEHQGSTPQIVTYMLNASISTQLPDASSLDTDLPTISNHFHATAYDNNPDYGGTSGYTTSVSSDTNSFFDNFTNVDSEFSLFIGGSDISFEATAGALGSIGGGGNAIFQFISKASADLIVTYEYTPTNNVPLPATLWLLGSGLIGLVGFGRKLLG